MLLETKFRFSPRDWVLIVFAGLNYRGRISKCILYAHNEQGYWVEYINDTGDFKEGEFKEDELSLCDGGCPHE